MKFIARVPATRLGHVFVEGLKEYWNKEDYKLIVRYSGKRKTYFGGHTRKEDADSMRIYVEPLKRSPRPTHHLNWKGTSELQIKLDEQERRLAKQAETIDQLMERDSQVHRIKEILE